MESEEFAAIEAVYQEHFPGAIVSPSLLFATSDSRFFRRRGVTAYGVFPALLSMADIQQIHGIDEKISVENMVRGTAAMQTLVRRLCAL
jgi:acetylornithine deacetylase/succinyl-diaminopimelate desuccinylase-like protein